jgi:hypothetical protein
MAQKLVIGTRGVVGVVEDQRRCIDGWTIVPRTPSGEPPKAKRSMKLKSGSLSGRLCGPRRRQIGFRRSQANGFACSLIVVEFASATLKEIS